LKADPAVDNVLAFTGGGTLNSARMFIVLKPLNNGTFDRGPDHRAMRPKLQRVPGATLYLQASQDVRVGDGQSNAQYQFTMQGDNLEDLVK